MLVWLMLVAGAVLLYHSLTHLVARRRELDVQRMRQSAHLALLRQEMDRFPEDDILPVRNYEVEVDPLERALRACDRLLSIRREPRLRR